jgi:ABC-type glycerol-3-phosphate transport system permease component
MIAFFYLAIQSSHDKRRAGACSRRRFQVMQLQGLADTLKYVVIVVATLPLMCVYPFVQKYFVKGVMIGSVKG